MSRLLFPNQMKVDPSKKKPSADSPAPGILPVASHPSSHPQSSAETTTNKSNIIPINSFSAVASNVNILDQIMNGMSQSQMSKKDWIVRVNLFLELHKPKALFRIEKRQISFMKRFGPTSKVFPLNLSEVILRSALLVAVFVELWTSPVQVYIVLICYWFLIIFISVTCISFGSVWPFWIKEKLSKVFFYWIYAWFTMLEVQYAEALKMWPNLKVLLHKHPGRVKLDHKNVSELKSTRRHLFHVAQPVEQRWKFMIWKCFLKGPKHLFRWNSCSLKR